MQTAQWNPNSPQSTGLELSNQGASFRRIAGLQQQLLTFKALATENITSALIPAGPGTVVTSQLPPRKPKFAEAIPDYGSLPMNAVDGVICADIGYAPQTIYINEYLPASIGSVMNGTTDHRYSRNDDIGARFSSGGDPLPSVDTVNTGLVTDIQTAGDGNWLSDPRGNKNLGSSSFTFDCSTFPSGNHVLAVEFVVRANGPIMVTFANNEAVPGTWRTSPARVYYDSKEFQDNVYRIGEAYMENRDGVNNEIWRLSPLAFVRGFSPTSALRRLIVATDLTPQTLPLVRVRIDSILMRVYSTSEARLATGWVNKSGRVTLRVPSDVRSPTDTTSTPAPYAKTINQTQNLLLRQYYPGNIPMPSMVLSTPRIQGLASFSPNWVARDTIGHPQTSGPINPAQAIEPVIPAITLFTALNNDAAVTAETQPYSASGGVFPYSGVVSGGNPTTKILPAGVTTGLAYALVSDTFGPKNNITFTLGSTPSTGGSTTSVTLTPAQIAAFPVVGYSTVSGSGSYGSGLPWNLPPSVVRWRRVRLEFPGTITTGGSGGRISVAAQPNAVSLDGFIQNYLVGALFPQTVGGLYPGLALSGDVSVPSVATDGNLTYNSSVAYADLQVVLVTTVTPTPTISTASVTSGTQTFPRITLTWSAGGGLGAQRFEIERYDDITGYWQRIIQSPITGVFDDFEARFNVPSTYRARAVRTDGAESLWVTSVAPTPTQEACTLTFSSNFDSSINVAYTDAYSGDTSQTFSSRDASSVSFQRIYGKEYEVAFRQAATGGVEFTRTVLLPTTVMDRPAQNANQGLLSITRNNAIPYLCVRDANGSRWFASVTQTTLLTTRAINPSGTPTAVASINIVETSKDPSVVGV